MWLYSFCIIDTRVCVTCQHTIDSSRNVSSVVWIFIWHLVCGKTEYVCRCYATIISYTHILDSSMSIPIRFFPNSQVPKIFNLSLLVKHFHTKATLLVFVVCQFIHQAFMLSLVQMTRLCVYGKYLQADACSHGTLKRSSIHLHGTPTRTCGSLPSLLVTVKSY